MGTAAVITGDIVNSTLLEPAVSKKLVASLSQVFKEHKFEFYRGDSFQVYIKDSRIALDLVLQSRAIARIYSSMHDVRASIGIGKMTGPVRTLRTAGGEAFIRSGRAFDSLVNDERLKIQSYNEEADAALRIIAYFLDHIFFRLTSKQAEVVLELLKEHTQVEVAKRLKKTQSTVNKHAQAAGWTEIERLLNEYQSVITQFNIV